MEVDWTQIKNALKKIENQLAEAEDVIERTDPANDWPEMTRAELEALVPRWREECGNNWIRDVMQKRIGKRNYRVRRGGRKYRVAPEALKALQVQSHDSSDGAK